MASRIAARRREKPGKNYEMVIERLRRRADIELEKLLGPPPEPDFLTADQLLIKAQERFVEARYAPCPTSNFGAPPPAHVTAHGEW